MLLKMGIKKTPEQIKNQILDELSLGPKTISELSDKIGSNWLTIEKFIRELMNSEDKKVCELISASKSKVYCSRDDLAFYYLPFPEAVRENTLALLHKISEVWKEKTNQNNIPKTKLQKIAVELIEEGNISSVPVLKFHYGQTLALRYEENMATYETFNLTPKQNVLLLQLINKYKNWFSNKVQSEQYKKKGMEFYKAKEELLEAFSNKNKEEIIKKILELSVYYPSELEETYELFDKFEYCSINILNINKDKEREEYINKLKEIFSIIWDVITTSYFFYEAEKYIKQDKKELFNYIKLNTLNTKIFNVSSIVNDLKSEVDAIPLEEINMKSSEKSKELLNRLLNGL